MHYPELQLHLLCYKILTSSGTTRQQLGAAWCMPGQKLFTVRQSFESWSSHRRCKFLTKSSPSSVQHNFGTAPPSSIQWRCATIAPWLQLPVDGVGMLSTSICHPGTFRLEGWASPHRSTVPALRPKWV